MFAITERPIQPEVLARELEDFRAGAYVSFEGRVRDHHDGRKVRSLEYEAFEELAVREGERVLEECSKKFDIIAARCVHRVGHLGLGEVAVWIGVTAAHRDEAFRASRYVIDEIKARLPIWKKEYWADGSAEWVGCHECGRHLHPDPAPPARARL